jgi:hypothetical protein
MPPKRRGFCAEDEVRRVRRSRPSRRVSARLPSRGAPLPIPSQPRARGHRNPELGATTPGSPPSGLTWNFTERSVPGSRRPVRRPIAHPPTTRCSRAP